MNKFITSGQFYGKSWEIQCGCGTKLLVHHDSCHPDEEIYLWIKWIPLRLVHWCTHLFRWLETKLNGSADVAT